MFKKKVSFQKITSCTENQSWDSSSRYSEFDFINSGSEKITSGICNKLPDKYEMLSDITETDPYISTISSEIND